ncbi:hypothetical protein Taro_028098, partial [Colocasia esculenta]|nr:hypothetical protein [Colocasia esculenta]
LLKLSLHPFVDSLQLELVAVCSYSFVAKDYISQFASVKVVNRASFLFLLLVSVKLYIKEKITLIKELAAVDRQLIAVDGPAFLNSGITGTVCICRQPSCCCRQMNTDQKPELCLLQSVDSPFLAVDSYNLDSNFCTFPLFSSKEGLGSLVVAPATCDQLRATVCRNHWQLIVICNKGDNDMPFLMLLDSLHMEEPTRIENELKNFLKIAYEGKEMRAVADELKVIDLHVPKVPQQKESTKCGFMVLYFIFRFILTAPATFGTNDYPSFLTADWFSREEYEKFREDQQGKRIHIDARSASTSRRKFHVPISLRDFVMKDLDQKWRSWKYDLRTKFFTPYQKAQQHFACLDRRVVEDQWKNLVQIWSLEEIKFLKTGATLDRGDLFIRTHMKKAGGPINEESAAMIDKIRDIKLT